MSTALLPPRDGIELLAHQEVGARWMLRREAEGAPVCRGGVLGDDMGLGKTFQTIALLKNTPFVLRTLIVCPPAVIAGWRQELTDCGFRVSELLEGSPIWSLDSAADVVYLTSYSKVCLYSEFMADATVPFGRIILDEGHAIRNKNGRWVALMRIGKRATCRWILSATPVQNGAADWRNLCLWLRVRCTAAAIPALGPLIMLRRTMAELRADIESLPAAPRFVTHDLHIPEESTEGKLFGALCNQLQSVIDSRAVSALIKLELYLRIQQFLVHPQVYIESMRAKFRGAYPRGDWDTASGGATKWTACMAELARSVEEKCPTIVFCQFRDEMDRVMAAATEMGGEVWTIRGGMGADGVGEAIRESREAALDGRPVVMVVQIVSGGAGVNLQFCRRVLFLSQHWNPAVVHQAVGRAVRIGQRAVVEIHMFRVVDGVMDNMDRKMVEIHLRKIGCAQEVCPSLYEGYAPLKEDAFMPIEVPSSVLAPAPALHGIAPPSTPYTPPPAAASAAAEEDDEDPTGDDPVSYGGVEDVD